MWIVGLALAGTPGFYHPDDVAKASAAFRGASEAIGPAFEAKSMEVERAGGALEDLETATLLLGKDAPPDALKWAEDTRRQVTGQAMRIQKHVDLLQEDYGKVFGEALGRAVPGVTKGYDAKECKAGTMMGMRVNTSKCVGEDLNGALAKALDADARLKSELAGIAAVEWPSVTLPSAKQPVVALTGTTRWVDGAALADAHLTAYMAARRDDLDREVGPLLEDGNTPENVKKAQQARAAWDALIGDAGGTYRAALTTSLTKQKLTDVGWCANPRSLGGCAGEDVTRQVLDALAADKKFQKAMAGFAEK